MPICNKIQKGGCSAKGIITCWRMLPASSSANRTSESFLPIIPTSVMGHAAGQMCPARSAQVVLQSVLWIGHWTVFPIVRFNENDRLVSTCRYSYVPLVVANFWGKSQGVYCPSWGGQVQAGDYNNKMMVLSNRAISPLIPLQKT